MLVITCENCGESYRVDETKMRSESAKLKCRKCDTLMMVSKSKSQNQEIPDPLPRRRAQVNTRPSVAEKSSAPRSRPAQSEAAGGEALSFESKKVRFGLAIKLVILMLFVSLVPLAVFWGVTFKEGTKQVEADTELLMSQITEGLGNQIEEWLDKNARVLKAGARLPEIVSMDRTRQEPVLKAVQQEYPWMYLVFTVGLNGMNVARNDGKPLVSYADRDYYKEVIGGKPLAWQTLIGRTSNVPALVLAVPIRSGDKVVGILAAAMTTEEVSKSVATWKRGNTGFAFLVDEKGKVVAHQLNQYVVSEKNLSAHPLVAALKQKREGGTLSFTNEQGRPSLGHVRGNNYGWALAIQQENEEVFATLRRIQRLAIFLLALTIVLVAFIAWVSARRVTRPIMTLTTAAEQMSLGNLNLKIDIKSKDEIGLLAQAVTRMQTSLRLALERLKKRV